MRKYAFLCMSTFQSCYNAFRREHVPSTYLEFVTFTWLSKEHSFKTFFYVSLYLEEERCLGNSLKKAGNRPLLQPLY